MLGMAETECICLNQTATMKLICGDVKASTSDKK